MWIVYYVSVTTVGTFVTDWTNDVFVVAIQDAATSALSAIGAGDMVMGLVVDGIIGGLGAVLGFVPQMAILFLSCLSLKTVDTWFVSHSSWTVCSDISDFRERALSRF